jgi:sigma-B regulation protein RsbU (phosphoserine phosphatase)
MPRQAYNTFLTLLASPFRRALIRMSAFLHPSSRLAQAVDHATLKGVQDGLATTTATTVAIVDENAHALLLPSNGHLIGTLLAGTPDGAAAQRLRLESAAASASTTEREWVDEPSLGLAHLIVPIRIGNEWLGSLVLGDRPNTPWSEDHARAVASCWQLDPNALVAALEHAEPWDEHAHQVATDVGRSAAGLLARLCDQERQLKDRLEELAAVYDLANMLVGNRDLQDILDQTARKVCEVMGTKACSIRLYDEQRDELVIMAVYNLSEQYLNKGPVTVERNPIDAEAFKGNIVYIEEAPNDSRVRYPEEARREGIVSGLVCGMVYRGKPIGVIRVYTGRKHRFTPSEWGLLRAIAAQAAAAIVNARLYRAAVEAERYERQLKLAGDVQRRMIPAAPPAVKHAELGCVYCPSLDVGGDFYDFIELAGGNLGIAIADVVGKGLPAALTMASLRSALRVYSYHVYNVEEIMNVVNDHVARETRVNEFATVFYGVLTPDGRRLTYCNAGHDPPLLLRSGVIRSLDTGGMALGVHPDAKYGKAILPLEPGDVLLLYTDGLVEALDFADEAYGRTRLRESFIRHARLDAGQLVQQVLWDVRRFIGLADVTDDMTAVAVRIR